MLFLLIPTWAMAWNVVAHQVIAQIAYDQLTPQARKMVAQRYPVLGQFYPTINSFNGMASWPDFIKGDDITAFNKWHYIDKPLYFEKIRHPRRVYPPNVVWAIHRSEQVLTSKKSNLFEQSLFLAFLVHFVGDIHQPLHTVSLYSHRFPHGDKGGNLFKIHSPIASNLHKLWDDGFGLFPTTYQPTPTLIRQLATQIETTYPASGLTDEINNMNVAAWASESYDIAKQQVYQIKPNTHPSKTYIAEGKSTVQQRMALAGYRLGKLLNTIYH
jgi:hypothetical protein